MNDNSKTQAFLEAINNDDNKQWLLDVAEQGIDACLDNNSLLQQIPIVNFVVAGCKTTMLMRQKHDLYETCKFLEGFKGNSLSEQDKIRYRSKFDADTKKAEKELSNILIILDSHYQQNQSKRLGKIYRKYLDETFDDNIFHELVEVNRRCFDSDIDVLLRIQQINKQHIGCTDRIETKEAHKAERLNSVGLISIIGTNYGIENILPNVGNGKSYYLTELGEDFVNCIKEI